MGGLLQALLGGSPEESASPTDSIIKMILGSNSSEGDSGAPSEGMPEEVQSGGGGGAGPLADVLPPSVASKVAANPGSYPNLAAILGQKQTKVNPMKPLDYLIAAASPVVAGLSQMMMSRRRSDRAGNFAAGLAGGGLSAIANLASRPERMQQAQRERDIENILLQQKVRGTPTGGVNTQTGTPEFRFPGTNEVATPGFGPQPRVARIPKIVNERDAQGNESPYEVNDKGEATPITKQQGNIRVPMVSKPKPPPPEKPLRELRVGSDIAGAKKGSESDQYYWMEQGKDPVPSGLYRSVSDRPTREGDINRSETKQVSQWAVKALQDSHTRLGPGKKPEEYVNDATETFRQASGTSKALAEKAPQVANAIRTMGRSVKSGDELLQMLGVLMADKTGAAPQK